VGSPFGIDLRIHGTFVVLLGWIVLSHLVAGHGLSAAAEGLALVVTVFGVVVLHELGHALVARRFGIRTRDITLLPIGGVARLERMPTDPRQEFLVALAGPLVNVALAALAFAVILVAQAPWWPGRLAVVGGPLLAKFLWFNVTLAVFNLLPAFPMDGGRVLRALLSMRTDRLRATDIAARVGQWMALGFGLLGLFGHPMLVFIAFFVWIGAAEEARLAHVTVALDSVRVGDAMVTAFETLPANASVGEGLQRVIRTTQRDFPVHDGARLIGFVSAAELLVAAERGDARSAIGSVVRPLDESAAPNELVTVALERLEGSGASVLPVLDAARLVGLLVPENVVELARVRERQALHAPVLHAS
jgi:Zn-dependent protease/CBS domain-containing protein